MLVVIWGTVSVGYRKAKWRLNDIFRICETNILLLNGKSCVYAQAQEFQNGVSCPWLCCCCEFVLPLSAPFPLGPRWAGSRRERVCT